MDQIESALEQFNEWYGNLRDLCDDAPTAVQRRLLRLSVEFEKLDEAICASRTPAWNGSAASAR